MLLHGIGPPVVHMWHKKCHREKKEKLVINILTYFLELPSPTETGSVHLEVSKEEREIEHLTEVRDVY